MSSDVSILSEQEKRQQRRGRIQAVAIMLGVLLPLVVAYSVYYTGVGMPKGTINKGHLITPPQPNSELALHKLDGERWQLSGEARRWRCGIPGGAECDARSRDST